MPEKSRFCGEGCGKRPVWAKGTHGLAGSLRGADLSQRQGILNVEAGSSRIDGRARNKGLGNGP